MKKDASQGMAWTRVDALTEACDVDGGRLVLGVSGRTAMCNFETHRTAGARRPRADGPVDLPGSHFVGAPPAMRFGSVDEAKAMLAHASRITSFGDPARLLRAAGFSNVAWGRQGEERSETWLRRRGGTRQEVELSPGLLTLDEHAPDSPRRNVVTFDLDRRSWDNEPIANEWPRFLSRQASLVMLAILLADRRAEAETSLAA